MRCPKCGLESSGSVLRCECGYEFNAGEEKVQSPNSTLAEKKVNEGMFKESDYLPFMFGIFFIGGLLVIPFTWGIGVGLGYFAALPWSLASCIVFLIAFRQNGTISWGRAIPAIFIVIIVVQGYAQETGKPAFATGGILGFLVITMCGYIGIGIGRLIHRGQ